MFTDEWFPRWFKCTDHISELLTFDPLSLKIISTSRILPNCWKCQSNFYRVEIVGFNMKTWALCMCEAQKRGDCHTPNIWRRSGSLKRKGMFETWRRFGWVLPDPSSSLPLPAPPPDDTDTLRDWGSEDTGTKESSWQWESTKQDKEAEEEEEASKWIEEEWTGRTKKDGKQKMERVWMRWDRCEEKLGEGISRKAKKEKRKTNKQQSKFNKFNMFQRISCSGKNSSCVSITWH